MSGRTVILLLLGIISISVVTFRNIYNTSTWSNSNTGRFMNNQTSRNLAHTGINLAYRNLRTVSNYSSLNGKSYTKSLFGGTVTCSFLQTNFSYDSTGAGTFASIPCTRVVAVGIFNGDTCVDVVFVKEPQTNYKLDKRVKAALGSTTNIKAPGQSYIDGRDHDISKNVLPGSGTFAIWTKGTIDNSGKPELGGTFYDLLHPATSNFTLKNGTDIAPPGNGKDYDDRIVSTGNTGYFPDNPDSVIGPLANGRTLKETAIDLNHYYTTTADIPDKLDGISYVDMAQWQPTYNISGTGILVIHNSSNNATFKFVGKSVNFDFRGIIIADKLDNFHGTIVGAVVELFGSNGGNDACGQSEIYYSREALGNAESYLPGAPKKVKDNTIAWWEGRYQLAKHNFGL